MEERELKKKIEINAKKLVTDPKNRTLLLKGKELEESLIYLSEENRKFMLTREIELIEKSIKYRDRKKALIDIFLTLSILAIIGILFFVKKETILNTFNKDEKIFKKEERIELKEPQKEIKENEEEIKVVKEINKSVNREETKVIEDQNKTTLEENISTKNYNIIDENGSN